jgi:hypothetical protein
MRRMLSSSRLSESGGDFAMAKPKPRARFPEDRPVSDEVARAIGHVIVEWGRLEDSAIVLAAQLIDTDHHDFRAIGVNLATGAKFDALAALTPLLLSKRKSKTILSLCAEAKGLMAERNRIVHGCWLPTRNAQVAERHAYLARGSLAHHEETVSASRLMGFAAQIIRLNRRFNYALERYGFFRRPDKPRPA